MLGMHKRIICKYSKKNIRIDDTTHMPPKMPMSNSIAVEDETTSLLEHLSTPPKWARTVCFMYLGHGVVAMFWIVISIGVFVGALSAGYPLGTSVAAFLFSTLLSIFPLMAALVQFWVCRSALR
jgi:hypothetical protein